jgi:predicted site-specific integrase-resolvase
MATVAKLLVSAREAAELVGVDEETWRRWDRAGRTPQAVRPTSGCTRWKVTDLQDWISAGCPSRRRGA